MAIYNSLNITAHKNIYSDSIDRKLRIDYSIPQLGINENTGLLMFVPGFGGHIDSNVYKKMRDQFSDKYNLVTVQCHYFGSDFMQSSDNYRLRNSFSEIAHHFTVDELRLLKQDISQLIPIFSTKASVLSLQSNQVETDELFVDMGFMQAIDIITSIEVVKSIFKQEGRQLNSKKIVGFGQSHGSFLLHLCNRLAPHLFSIILDNAAWVIPQYLFHNRYLYQQLGTSTLEIEFDYYAKRRIIDKDALHLENLYANFNNGAYIYSYIGTTDNLVDVESKRKCVEHLDYVEFEVIDEKKVDGVIFRSTNHGLDADFLKLVDYIFSKNNNHVNPISKKDSYDIISSNTRIKVDYSGDIPVFEFI